MMRRWQIRTIFALIILCLILSLFYVNSNKTLKIGVITGSNWDVPSPDALKIVDNAIERFEKEHVNVQVEYISGIRKEDYSEWLSQQALSGDVCDVFMVLSNDLATFADVGILENLSSFIENDPDFDESVYFFSSYQSGQVNHVQYALPYESVPTLMYVNRTLLESEGVEVPKQDWTWEDFYEICARMTQDTNEDGILDQFGQFGYTWQNAIFSNGAKIFNDEGSNALLENDRVYDAIEFMRRLEKLNRGQSVTSEMFDKGQVVFCPMSFSEYRAYKPYPWSVKKYSSFEWDCIPMPAGPDGSNVSQLDTLLIGMSKNSKYKDLAWEFLKELSFNEETQKDIFRYSQGVSVLNTITDTKMIIDSLQDETPGGSDYDLGFFNSMMENAIPVKEFNGYEQAMALIDGEIKLLSINEDDIEAAIGRVEDQVDALLESVK